MSTKADTVDAIAKGIEKLDTNKAESEEKEEKEAEAHAEVGRRWLKQTLQKSGRTEADLARRLWNSNSTAVLEVGSYCSFSNY